MDGTGDNLGGRGGEKGRGQRTETRGKERRRTFFTGINPSPNEFLAHSRARGDVHDYLEDLCRAGESSLA